MAEQVSSVDMSTSALKDVNLLPILELHKKNENPNQGNFPNSILQNCSDNLANYKSMSCASSLSTTLNGSAVESNGADGGAMEVEYVETESLPDLPSVEATLDTLLVRLDSKEWITVCEALNNVRQVSVYHKEKLIDLLGDLIPKIMKSLKNPRSALCKTAIMTAADVFKFYNDSIIDFLDPLLLQLLLKSSQDKRFVCEASETALIAMTTWISPSLLLPKLLPHLKSKNPRVRAKASMCFSRSVPRLGSEGIKAYGMNNLIQIAASQLSDQLPESREAARALAVELQAVYNSSPTSPGGGDDDGSSRVANSLSWEAFCQTELSALSAQAILRVTSAAKA